MAIDNLEGSVFATFREWLTMISLTLLVSTEGAARAPTEASASRMVLKNCILTMVEEIRSQNMMVTGFEQRDV